MKFTCSVCGYVYDEAVEGVPFGELAEDFVCPICKADKSAFKGEEPAAGSAAEAAGAAGESPDAGPATTATIMDPALPVDEVPLTPGQLAALFSNLARGCEKQYNEDGAAKFRELADYFTGITPPETDATVIDLAQLLKTDLADYPFKMHTAKAAKDRGAQRALTWGEKVTTMLSSLVDRYLAEGEQMVADTEIWVCTACGYVWIGKEPPEQCPVCKVPPWKFEKVERRA